MRLLSVSRVHPATRIMQRASASPAARSREESGFGAASRPKVASVARHETRTPVKHSTPESSTSVKDGVEESKEGRNEKQPTAASVGGRGAARSAMDHDFWKRAYRRESLRQQV